MVWCYSWHDKPPYGQVVRPDRKYGQVVRSDTKYGPVGCYVPELIKVTEEVK